MSCEFSLFSSSFSFFTAGVTRASPQVRRSTAESAHSTRGRSRRLRLYTPREKSSGRSAESRDPIDASEAAVADAPSPSAPPEASLTSRRDIF